MKNIILFDTSVATMNHGDEIINISFENNASELLDNNYVIKFPTHTPCFLPYQQLKKNKRFAYVSSADYKFICGTNIINNKMCSPWPFWNINFFNSRCYKNSILVGTGVSGFVDGKEKLSFYSRKLFSSFLSKEYVHSVRDEKTKRIITSLGLKAINTGCPTIWGLTKDFCADIPHEKSENVVFTLTDYLGERMSDQMLISVLKRNYKNIYFWPQGTMDYQYFKSLNDIDGIKVISPSVQAYDSLLQRDVDYVGTRLHAGIFALQHKCRSVILAVDNRAKDMAETYYLNVLPRDDYEQIENKINSSFETNVQIDEEAISAWKSQFV